LEFLLLIVWNYCIIFFLKKINNLLFIMEKTNYLKHIFKKHTLSVFCILAFVAFASIYFFIHKVSATPLEQVQANYASGLNDATFSGNFNLNENATFTVMIDGVNLPLPGAGCVTLSGLAGSFNDGDIVVGEISGATALVEVHVRCFFGGQIYFTNVVGTFSPDEAISSSSGGTGIYNSDAISFPEGTSDTISWTETGGAGGSGTGVSINNLFVVLDDGISVDFGASSGHTLSDYWTYTITSGQTQVQTDDLQVPENLNDATYSGIFSGDGDAVFTVTIDGEDVPSSDPSSGCIFFNETTGDFNEGDTITGQTSNATGVVTSSMIMCNGIFFAYDLLKQLTNVIGTFSVGETVLSSSGGSTVYVTDNIIYVPPSDTISWTETGGAGGSGTGIALESGAYSLADGISITFDSTIGHTLGDSWIYTITANAAPLPAVIPVISHIISTGTTRQAIVWNQELMRKAEEELEKKEVTVATEQTENNLIKKINFKPAKNLFFGENNLNVKDLQKYLNALGFIVASKGPGSIGNETNYFGNLTFSAVKKFQKENNLKPDGIVGPLTITALNLIMTALDKSN